MTYRCIYPNCPETCCQCEMFSLCASRSHSEALPMTRAELALWDRAYRIADIARVGWHPFHSERDPLAQHLMAETIVRFASATEARVHPATGAVGSDDHSNGTPDSRGQPETSLASSVGGKP